MRTKDTIHQELVIEQARFAELERAREEARTKIELLRSELVQGDITLLWSDGLDRVCTESPLRLRGVATDSFRFCLRILVREHADVDAQVTRLDQNLFVWTMSTLPKPKNGTTPWQSPPTGSER